MTKQQAQAWIEANGTELLSERTPMEYMIDCIRSKADWPYSHAYAALDTILGEIEERPTQAIRDAAKEFADKDKDVIRIGDIVYYIDEMTDTE